jgi:oxygen-independent coproporphyrinogen-3 oxidase
LLYDYTEYPTKGNWDESFGDEEYKKTLSTWLKKNPKSPILFYIHTPFCEQLCYFCLCSKEITKDYDKVKSYLYDYLFKEIDLLFSFLKSENIDLNVRELYFGGGSPTYYKEEDFSNLMTKLKESFEFSKLGDATVEVDPRRVSVENLLNYKRNGINRLSFGIQEFDLEVQKRINRIQPPELIDNLLTQEIRKEFPVINFDLLIGLPGQTKESVRKTIQEVIRIRPTQLQTLMMHYKPQTRKYMINMLRDGPLPDFYERKIFYSIIEEELLKSDYVKTGYEMFALKDDPIAKAVENKKALYASLGTQKGEATNFVAIGSSAHGCLGDEYYSQNFYELNLYKESIENGKLPIYRGKILSKDDKIRRNIIKTIRTYFEIDYKEIEENYKINFKDYFSSELLRLESFAHDNLVNKSDEKIIITDLGRNFTPQVANIFDKYNPLELDSNKI